MAKSKKPRKKYNPNKVSTETPVLIRYSKAEGEALKIRIFFHLNRLLNEEADSGDWIALRFRIRIGTLLTQYFNESSIVSSLNHALDTMDAIKVRSMEINSWNITKEEDQILRNALVTIDEMLDQTTRKEQLPAFIKADKEVNHSLFDTLKKITTH